MDPVTAGLITTGVSAGIAGGQQIQAGKLNKKNMKWQEDQALLQRKYALEDYDRTNAYNAPSAQKARMLEAGLNPNMMYGGSGGSTPSATVRSTPMADYKQTAPPINMDMSAIAQLPLLQAQNEALRLANEAKRIDNQMLKEATGLKAPTLNPFIEYGPGADDGYGRVEYRDATQQLYLANNPYMGIDPNTKGKTLLNTITENTTEAQIKTILANSVLAELNSNQAKYKNPIEIKILNQALEQAKSETAIKQAQAKLASMNISLSDPIYVRLMIALLGQ